jgi:hypothetical protein
MMYCELMCVLHSTYKISNPPPLERRVTNKWRNRLGGGNLQTDAAQLFLFVPIPATAKKLGLLSIYKFSLPPPPPLTHTQRGKQNCVSDISKF